MSRLAWRSSTTAATVSRHTQDEQRRVGDAQDQVFSLPHWRRAPGIFRYTRRFYGSALCLYTREPRAHGRRLTQSRGASLLARHTSTREYTAARRVGILCGEREHPQKPPVTWAGGGSVPFSAGGTLPGTEARRVASPTAPVRFATLCSRGHRRGGQGCGNRGGSRDAAVQAGWPIRRQGPGGGRETSWSTLAHAYYLMIGGRHRRFIRAGSLTVVANVVASGHRVRSTLCLRALVRGRIPSFMCVRLK